MAGQTSPDSIPFLESSDSPNLATATQGIATATQTALSGLRTQIQPGGVLLTLSDAYTGGIGSTVTTWKSGQFTITGSTAALVMVTAHVIAGGTLTDEYRMLCYFGTNATPPVAVINTPRLSTAHSVFSSTNHPILLQPGTYTLLCQDLSPSGTAQITADYGLQPRQAQVTRL